MTEIKKRRPQNHKLIAELRKAIEFWKFVATLGFSLALMTTAVCIVVMMAP